MTLPEILLSIALGIGLSAACGFRVFVPLLIMSIASFGGHLTLAQGFEWIGTVPALVLFATATVLEVLAYYIPWLDHIMDFIATPAAVIAGILATASVVGDVSPVLKWALALIGGGGIAGTIQGASVLMRAKSTALSGGAANFLVASGELAGSVATSVLAIAFPLACLLLLGTLLFAVFRGAGRWVFGRSHGPS